MKSINPFSLKLLKTFRSVSENEITQILPNIHNAYEFWKKINVKERAKLFLQLEKHLKDNVEKYGKIATLEMGKPIKQAKAEVEKCAWLCNYYATNAERFLEDEYLETDYEQTIISYQPIGAVLAVMPWNFPYWQVFRFAVPTLMAGNVGILKHASNVPQCALAMQDMFKAAGFPEFVFNALLLDSKNVDQVIESDVVQAITLTGSEKAGSIVSSKAASEIKKAVLELGGSDSFIVLPDANLDNAIDKAVVGRFQNNGQSCIAAKRFFIHEDIYEDFMNLFVEKVNALKLGDPLNEDVYIGPLAKSEFVNDIAKQVNESVEKGATIAAGGKITGEHNQFYLPTILEHVKPGMPAFDEEIFGPVAACIKIKTVEEAIDLANQSDLGLGGSVYTSNIEEGIRIAKQIETGTVVINDYVKSDPRIPFGGVKRSGFGRELGKEGIREFVNIKAINVAKTK